MKDSFSHDQAFCHARWSLKWVILTEHIGIFYIARRYLSFNQIGVTGLNIFIGTIWYGGREFTLIKTKNRINFQISDQLRTVMYFTETLLPPLTLITLGRLKCCSVRCVKE